MKWFVHRRPDSSIASWHSEAVPGYAEEQLDDTDAALAPLVNPAPPTKLQRLQARFVNDPEFAALVKRMARAEGKTLAQLAADVAQDMP